MYRLYITSRKSIAILFFNILYCRKNFYRHSNFTFASYFPLVARKSLVTYSFMREVECQLNIKGPSTLYTFSLTLSCILHMCGNTDIQQSHTYSWHVIFFLFFIPQYLSSRNRQTHWAMYQLAILILSHFMCTLYIYINIYVCIYVYVRMSRLILTFILMKLIF